MASQTTHKDTLAGIRAQLAEQAAALERRCEETQTELNAYKAESSRVRAALQALDNPTGPRRRSTGRRPGTFDLPELVKLICAILQPNATMSFEHVRAKVEDEARSADRSLVGLHVRLRKALRHENFIVATDGMTKVVRLRTPSIDSHEQTSGLVAPSNFRLTTAT